MSPEETMNNSSDQSGTALAENIRNSNKGEALDLCLTCGQCVSRCFLTDDYDLMNPRKLIRKTITGDDQEVADSEFIWACTLCGRCTTDCPKDLKMDLIMRKARGLAYSQGKAPKRIVDGIEMANKIGNTVGMDAEDWEDTVEWLVEEAEEEFELEEGSLKAPIDKEGAQLLYIPNPREYTSNPHMFQMYVRFMNLIGADWTLSSKVFDITNWAYYMGQHDQTVGLIRNMAEEARRLGVKSLLSTECGHGFKVLRLDAQRWLGEPLGFEVISVVELAHRRFKDGSVKFKPDCIEEKVTYHDPCNVGRKLGIFEEPRELLRHICKDYVEIWPNRKYNICCGGGGSVGQNTDMAKKRLEHAKRKRDQILNTGASILATCCQNCLAQLNDLQARYDMPLKVKSVLELLTDCIETDE
jgi:Fe-S oxidoreductase